MGAVETQGDRRPPRIRLETPDARHCEAFLAAVNASRALHHPWVSPPSTRAGFRAYLDKLGSPRELGLVGIAVARLPEIEIAIAYQ